MGRLIIVTSAVIALIFGAYLSAKGNFPSAAAAASSGGTISGRVVFVGDPPQAKKIKVTKDNEKCGAEITAEDLVVSADKSIQNAVVSVVGLKGTPQKSDKTPTLDQKGCVFHPHVVIVPIGSGVDILNSDGVLHNFHTYSNKNPVVNKAQPGFKKKMTESFAQPEIIKINCDAHSWMSAWIVVTDHPYIDATDNVGAFKIVDVPPGTHTVEVWHETLGKVTKTVTVKAGEEAKLIIELAKK
jgi:plastocyanin